MKFKLIDEVYFSRSNLEKHYQKHVLSDTDGKNRMPNMTMDNYNQLADFLSSAPASKLNDRNARIIGYVNEDDRIVKYDKLNNFVVIYTDDPKKGHEVISFYKQPFSKFINNVNNKKGCRFKHHIMEK